MRAIFTKATLWLAALVVLASCSKDNFEFGEPALLPEPVTPNTEAGYLAFGDDALRVSSDMEIVRSSAVDTGDFQCMILHAETFEEKASFTYGERPAEPIELKVGAYILYVSSGQAEAAAWEAPVYEAVQPFTILRDETTTLENIPCYLQNVKVTVEYADELYALLEEGTEAAVTLGEHTMTFAYTEERAAYFAAPDGDGEMALSVNLKFDGLQQELRTTLSNVRSGQWRKIFVTLPHISEGQASLSVKVETLTLKEKLTVDVAEYALEPVIPEDPFNDPLAPTILCEAFDLSTTTQIDATMFDAEGAFLMPVVLESTTTKSTLAAYHIEVASTSAELTAALQEMGLPLEFDLCQADAALQQLLEQLSIPSGEAVLGQTAVSVPLTALMPTLYGFDGTHEFRLMVTDTIGRSRLATLSILVDRDNEAAPPTIVWVDHDIKQAYTIYADPEICTTGKLEITAPAAIKGFTVDIVSNILTAEALDGLLPTHLDLVNPDPSYEEFLSSLFPVRDQVEGQTYISGDVFDITEFLPVLAMLAGEEVGYANFVLTVTDTKDRTTVETMQLLINQ